jgi:hypothetical protein
VWQNYLIHDGDAPGGGNLTAYKVSDPLEVEDATGESDNVTGRSLTKGYVWLEGPNSGYKPDFISPDQWMGWQSVYWIPSPRSIPSMPNPPRWVRVPGERKVRWGGHGGWEFLWCQKCETWLEATWSDVLVALPIAARGIAMIASYIPVYGTALSLVINTTVSLAEGESVDEALIDGIGGALPGQPTSGMVYKAGVAIAKGERIDQIGIAALGLDKSVTNLLKAADDVVYGILSGQNVTDVAYSTIRKNLPPEAQQGMDYARRVINGENIPEMVLSEAEQMALNVVRDNAQSILQQAKGQGAEALRAADAKVNAMFNQYAAEFGYQMALDRLPSETRGSIQLGLVVGTALKPKQFVGTFDFSDKAPATNDGYAAKGRQIIATGARYRNLPLADILQGSKFTIVVNMFNTLEGHPEKRAVTYDIDNLWRRGFEVAIGLCEGMSEDGPGQQRVKLSLGNIHTQNGFDAGQAVQHNRTLFGNLGLDLSTETTTVESSSGSAFPAAAAPARRPRRRN